MISFRASLSMMSRNMALRHLRLDSCISIKSMTSLATPVIMSFVCGTLSEKNFISIAKSSFVFLSSIKSNSSKKRKAISLYDFWVNNCATPAGFICSGKLVLSLEVDADAELPKSPPLIELAFDWDSDFGISRDLKIR